MKKWIYQKKKNNKMNEYDTLDKGDTNKICEYIWKMILFISLNINKIFY